MGQFKHAEKGQLSFLSKKASSLADKMQLPPHTTAESTFPQSQFIKGGGVFFVCVVFILFPSRALKKRVFCFFNKMLLETITTHICLKIMYFQPLLHHPKGLPALLGKAAYSLLRARAGDYLIRWQPSPCVSRDRKAPHKIHPSTLVRDVYM